MALGITFSAGQKVFASDLQDMVDQIDSLTAPGWTNYTTVAPSGGSAFALTASTTNPTQGNSTYLAEFRRPASCDLIEVRIRIVIGSTFSVGSGNYRFGLPFTATTNSGNVDVGSLWINDSGTALRAGWVSLDNITTYATCWVDNGTSAVGVLTQAFPQTWATNDVLKLRFSYEPA